MEDQPWDRVDVSDWPLRFKEALGSNPNDWLEEPGTGKRWLHKYTVIPSNGAEQGEDWSEVVATQVAGCLKVPVAPTRLCWRNGRRGSISREVTPHGYSLHEGNLVLESAEAPGYFPHTEESPGRDPARPEVKRPGHTLANIRDALGDVMPPPGFMGHHEMTGFDVFAGYMILDAVIANRDRHEQNWAVLTPQLLGPPRLLAPSYDHAGGLGYNLADPQRRRHVETPERLERWAQKGTCHRFEHVGNARKAPTLVEHARRAVEMCSPVGARWWRQQLDKAALDPVLEVLRERVISEMSADAATFARNLLVFNLGRLRDALCQRD